MSWLHHRNRRRARPLVYESAVSKTTSGWTLVGVQALLLLALFVAPARRGLAQLWPPDAAAIIGVLLMAMGVVIGLLAARTLSSALTPTPVPRAGEGLRTSGVYAWVRHPIYFAWVLMVFAAPRMTSGRLLFAVISTTYLVVAIPYEERGLRAEFGEPYAAYQRQVRWRIVPGIW